MSRFLLLGLILALLFAATKLFPSLTAQDASRRQGVSYVSIPMSQNQPAPGLSAQHVFVLDQQSKTVLFQKDADAKVFPASTTKMMTALVALDKFPLDQIITVSRSYLEGQTIGLQPREQLSVEQLLYAMLVQSGNDAAEVLAENYSGGRSAFVEAMNYKAAGLNLDHTHFVNPTGLDEAGHFSSATDLARLADTAITHPEFSRIVATENAVVANHVLTNINELLGRVPGVLGVKTGFTDGAGQSLVTLVSRDSHPVILVVLGSTDRFGDSEKLINWVYSNFHWE